MESQTIQIKQYLFSEFNPQPKVSIPRNPYRDSRGRFCNKRKDKDFMQRQINYWRTKYEIEERKAKAATSLLISKGFKTI